LPPGPDEDTYWECSDFDDNDNDTYIDCQDTGCQYLPYCTYYDPDSPILIDILGNDFSLTGPQDGVFFDIDGKGVVEQLSWTTVGSDDAWLALDRNENGMIDSGLELFGNHTQQPTPPSGQERNGFLALAIFDKADNGGNNDGYITKRDTIFSHLKLWQDANKNGVSEESELFTLPQLGLRKIHLDDRESRRIDQYGNQFKYRAKVKDANDAQLGRWAWDVFLVRNTN